MAKGKLCFVQLFNRENELFVSCLVNPMFIDRSVQRTRDSSRYFVLTLVSPTGNNAYIGMGFDERNDAFDFWACLLDFSERIKNEENPGVESQGPDLSHLRLQEGQTFSLSGKPAGSSSNTGTSQMIKLKPPPK
jgi:Protein of unknown function (DUF1681).